jgi:cephalosporin-C deacetylase-like acetyl esterase
MDRPKYSNSKIFETTYKVVNSQKIQAFVFIPKYLQSGKYPVMGHIHGGFFVSI